MKTLFLALSVAISAMTASAAGFHVDVPVRVIVHPAQAYKSASARTILFGVSTALLEGVNATDYDTTRRGAFPGGLGACELNPLFRDHGQDCRINVTRFTAIKATIAVFGIAQWIPVWTGHAGDTYKLDMAILDGALSVPMGIADAGNIKWLRAHGAL